MDSPEYKTLTQCYPTLQSGLTQSPDDITPYLVPLGVLTPADLRFLNNPQNGGDKKAERTIQAVMSQVQNNPELFPVFIKALIEAGPWTKAIVNKLKQTYSSLLGATIQVPLEENSGESVNCNAPLHGDVASPNHSQSQTTRNFYQMFEDKPTYESNFEINERILEWETRQIYGKFAGLIVKVIQSIKNNYENAVKDLVTFLREIKWVNASPAGSCLLFTPRILYEIETTCSDINDVFTKLEGYYSWFNFDLVEEIIATFCDEDVKVNEKLFKYKAHLKEYCKSRLCQFPDPLNGFSKTSNHSVHVFKIDREWGIIRISEIDTIITTICKVLEIRRVTLILRAVSNGCVELTFNIPKHVTHALFPLSQNQTEELEKHGIRYCELQAPCDERMDVSDQQQLLGNDSDEDDPLQEATASDLPFIRLADEVATKSDDPNTKVGAIVVREGKVIGEGHDYLPHDAMASPHEKADTKKDEISSFVDTLLSYEAVSDSFTAGIPECDDEPPPRRRKKCGAGALDEKTLYQKKPDENNDEEQIQPHNKQDEEFMMMAQTEASNSPDPKFKVGAVIVNTSNSIVLGKGHNRMPKGCEHLPWSNDTNDLLDSKYPYVFHGAKAAIKDALEKKQDLKGATLYTTLLPANTDTQWIVELGIEEVVYRDNVFKHTLFTKAAKKIFKTSGTKLRRMK